MTADRNIQLRVGIFVSSGLILAMFIIFMIGGERGWFDSKYHLYCTFTDVSGLAPGASVSLAGMRVGSVVEVGFPQDLQHREIVVKMEIGTKFSDRIRSDSEASIVTQGLLGDKVISITVGGPDAGPLSDGDHIETAPSDDIYSLGRSAADVINKIRSIGDSVEDILDAVKNGDGAVHALVYDPQGKHLVERLSSAASSLGKAASRIEREGDLAGIMSNIKSASADLKVVMAEVRAGGGTLGGLLVDDSLYNDLRAIFGKINRNILLKTAIRSLMEENDRAVPPTDRLK